MLTRLNHFKVVPPSQIFRSAYRATQGYPPCPALSQKVSATYGRQILFETRLRPAIWIKPTLAGKSPHCRGSPDSVFIRPPGVLSSRTFSTMTSTLKDFESESAPTSTLLPDAPPWPCPVLNNSEINTYLPSLFTKRWGLTRNEKDMPILACKYRIKGYNHILNFVQSVGKIAQEEDVSTILYIMS